MKTLFLILSIVISIIQAVPTSHFNPGPSKQLKSILKHDEDHQEKLSMSPTSVHVRFNDAINIREFSRVPPKNEDIYSDIEEEDDEEDFIVDYVGRMRGPKDDEPPQVIPIDETFSNTDETGSDVRMMPDYNSILKQWQYHDIRGELQSFNNYLDAWDFVRNAKTLVRNLEWELGLKTVATYSRDKSYMLPNGGILLIPEFQHGVRFCDMQLKWLSFIPRSDKPEIVIGYFDDSRQAAMAYNKLMDEYFDKYGIRLPLNVIR